MLTADDDGSLSVLVLGYVAIAALLILVGVDVSKVFLAQRALASAADAAALDAAQQVDRAAIYAGRSDCALPVDPATAVRVADDAVATSADDLGGSLASVSAPDVTVDGPTVHVTLHGEVALPFGRVVALLLPNRPGGRIPIAATSSAESAVAAASCT